MSEWLRRLTIALQCAVYCACGGKASQPSAAVSATGTGTAGASGAAAGTTAAGSGTSAEPNGEAGRGAQTATGGAGAASDPMAMPIDRASFTAYPEVQFPPENPFTPEKALLGKALFWDEQLSSDNTMACGTCHRPAAGGSDPRPSQPGYLGNPGRDGTRGTEDDPKGSPGISACMEMPEGALSQIDDGIFGHMPQVGRRRAMTVLDAMFWDSMFWDGRVKGTLVDPLTGEMVIPKGAALEAQVFVPVLNAAEMSCKGRDWNMVVSKIAASKPLALASELPADLLEAQQSAYPDLFGRAFGDNSVTAARIAMAIATYERTLTANQTPWDRWRAGDDNALTPQQLQGFQMFVRKGQCACCHTAPLFGLPQLVDDAFHEISWDGGAAEMGMDKPGDYRNPTFRTVTARNSGLREASGLLHDGVAPGNSLEDLIAAYNMKPVRNVHFCRTELNLTDAEQAALVEFVRNGLTDPRAANEEPPFDRPKLASEAAP